MTRLRAVSSFEGFRHTRRCPATARKPSATPRAAWSGYPRLPGPRKRRHGPLFPAAITPQWQARTTDIASCSGRWETARLTPFVTMPTPLRCPSAGPLPPPPCTQPIAATCPLAPGSSPHSSCFCCCCKAVAVAVALGFKRSINAGAPLRLRAHAGGHDTRTRCRDVSARLRERDWREKA